jgi:hypothetical protein
MSRRSCPGAERALGRLPTGNEQTLVSKLFRIFNPALNVALRLPIWCKLWIDGALVAKRWTHTKRSGRNERTLDPDETRARAVYPTGGLQTQRRRLCGAPQISAVAFSRRRRTVRLTHTAAATAATTMWHGGTIQRPRDCVGYLHVDGGRFSTRHPRSLEKHPSSRSGD